MESHFFHKSEEHNPPDCQDYQQERPGNQADYLQLYPGRVGWAGEAGQRSPVATARTTKNHAVTREQDWAKVINFPHHKPDKVIMMPGIDQEKGMHLCKQ